MTSTQKGAIFPVSGEAREGVLELIKQALEKKCFEAVLIPARITDSSFAQLLIQDESLLKDAEPLPPVMPIQGAKAVSSITRHGKGNKKLAVMLRPCETRAAVELFKLSQVDLENLVLLSIDCPGVMKLADWTADPKKTGEAFAGLVKSWDSKGVRPLCSVCDKFSATGGEDLHIGTLGEKGDILLIPRSAAGESLLSCLGIKAEADTSAWQARIDKLTAERAEKKKQAFAGLEATVVGLDKLLDTFSKCINCHNCMRVCPICYCRQCLFDSDNMKFTFEDYLKRAEMAGGLRLPPETLLFQVGRMLHMSLSCVSCGMCEDACPTSIPVSRIFSLTGSKNQEEFGYVPGRSREEALPLKVFQEKEFEEVEQSHAVTSAKQEAKDA